MIPKLLEDCPGPLEPDEADALAIAWCGALQWTREAVMPAGLRGAR